MSQRLIGALDQVGAMPVITFGNIVDHIEEEALLILCLIAILPFMQPIPIPGLSSVLGLIVLLQGVGLMLWGRPLLTKRLREIVIPQDKFLMIQKAAVKFSAFTSKISAFKHPMVASRGSQILSGLSIVISAAFLSLPLPIPFSNLVPALSIFLICVGLLEDDVVILMIGHGITVSVIFMGIFSYHLITEQFFSGY